MMFRQVKQNRIFEDVVDQIQEAVLEGRLKAGDKLPAERALKDMFKTSRGTLREALRALEQKGLITIKTGVNGGAIIRPMTTHQMSESLSFLIRYKRVSLRHLAEFREDVEGMVTALAAERATRDDIAQLKEILSLAGRQLEHGVATWDDFIRIDNSLHMALAYVAGNPIYESVLKTVHDNIGPYYDRFLPREESIIQQNYCDLCAIVTAVEAGEIVQARVLAREHVCRFNRLMEQRA